MRGGSSSCAIIAALLLAGSAHAAPASERDRMYAAKGAEQQAYFTARLARLAEAIDRHKRTGALPRGPATFMRQDLDRVWSEMDRIIEQDGRLRPQQQASCAAMLSRVERRLLAADLRRRMVPMPLRVSRRRVTPESRAAF